MNESCADHQLHTNANCSLNDCGSRNGVLISSHLGFLMSGYFGGNSVVRSCYLVPCLYLKEGALSFFHDCTEMCLVRFILTVFFKTCLCVCKLGQADICDVLFISDHLHL